VTKREVASLAFTIAGIYALVEACKYLSMFGMLLQFMVEQPSNEGVGASAVRLVPPLVAYLPLPVLAAAGCVLIRYSGRLAAKLFPGSDIEDQALSADVPLVAAAFMIAGVIVVAGALQPFLAAVVSFFSVAVDTPSYARSLVGASVHLLGVGARMALGLALVFWARPIAQWWSSFSAAKWINRQWQKVRPLSGVREDEPIDVEE